MKKNIQTLIKYGKPLDKRHLNRGIEWRKEIAKDQRRLAVALIGHLDHLDCCPICKNTHTSGYVIIFDYPYDKCELCGHIFCATPLQKDAEENLYGTNSENKSVQSKIYLDDDLFLKRVEAIARPKVYYVADVMDTLRKKLLVNGLILAAVLEKYCLHLGAFARSAEFNTLR